MTGVINVQVASMISSMNPGINATTDSEELLLLQQSLLWLMYDLHYLNKCPMAIGGSKFSPLCFKFFLRPLAVRFSGVFRDHGTGRPKYAPPAFILTYVLCIIGIGGVSDRNSYQKPYLCTSWISNHVIAYPNLLLYCK